MSNNGKCPKPSLKLFVSLDIIGSTAFKNNNKGHISSNWFLSFQELYKNIPKDLAKQYKNNKFYLPYKWKIIGDEIIFVAELSDKKCLLTHIKAFISLLKSHNNRQDKLKLKATAWVAGFPVINAIIGTDPASNEDNLFKKEIVDHTNVDFIGPNIDLGFRISKFATKRKFIISIKLAKMLSEFEKDNNIVFHYDGKKETKGINNGFYPIIWLDSKCDTSKEEKLQTDYIAYDRDDIKDFCNEYIKESDFNGEIYEPFIYGVDDSPAGYEENYKNICKKIYSIEITNKENSNLLQKTENIKHLKKLLKRN